MQKALNKVSNHNTLFPKIDQNDLLLEPGKIVYIFRKYFYITKYEQGNIMTRYEELIYQTFKPEGRELDLK